MRGFQILCFRSYRGKNNTHFAVCLKNASISVCSKSTLENETLQTTVLFPLEIFAVNYNLPTTYHLKVLSLFVSSNWISRISAFFNFMLFSICAIFFLILKRGSQRELPFLRSIIFKRRSVKVKVVIYKSRDETFLWIII